MRGNRDVVRVLEQLLSNLDTTLGPPAQSIVDVVHAVDDGQVYTSNLGEKQLRVLRYAIRIAVIETKRLKRNQISGMFS